MKKKFNYLQNLDAVNEILKHKWIESEKARRDIGFATAVVDWIKRYGEEWKKANNIREEEVYNAPEELTERRKYRRFKIDLPVKINIGDLEIDAQLKEFNYIGANLVCKTSLAIGSNIEIALQPTIKEKEFFSVHFKSKVVKNTSYKITDNQTAEYLITALFDKNTQRLIINNKKDLFN